MPKVEIIHFTGRYPVPLPSLSPDSIYVTNEEKEHAARLLVFTKQTRLVMNGTQFRTVMAMPWEEIEKELDYMAGTIPSSWEFVDVVFALQQVSRACAQQITRTRFTPMDADIFGSYAMQSFRVGELDGLTFHMNDELAENRAVTGDNKMADHIHASHMRSFADYREAIAMGIPQQDARGLLPMDTHCNLVVKFNLRQLVDMLRTRDESLRVQGEYGEVAHQMKKAVLSIWPWSAKFFEPKDQKAIKMIEEVSKDLLSIGNAATGNEGYVQKSMATKLAKAADLLKK